MSTEKAPLSKIDSEPIGKILADPQKTLPALIFNAPGQIFHKITKKKPWHWFFNFVVLLIAVQIPTFLLSILFNETGQWDALGYLWMAYIELGFSGTVIAYLGIIYLFRNIEEYIVNAIQDKDHIQDLKRVLNYTSSENKGAIFFTIAFTLFWAISFSRAYTNSLGQFIGIGLSSGTIVFGLLMGPALYIEGWFFYFIIRSARYTYTLNSTDPANSEVVYRLYRTITTILYSGTLFIAFGTAIVAFNDRYNNIEAVWLVIFIGLIPITIYFIGSQISMNRIIIKAKWKTLNRVQEQINALDDGDITDKDNIDRINRLMDYHQRILATPNSMVNIRTGMSFLNQLALPFVGLLLANIESVIKFISQWLFQR